MTDLTPKQIVKELDRYIIGQENAKRAVAVALRNRWRRRKVEGPIKEEILPKNILMIGPTGVGKTEISRRIAKLAKAPFIKVEATKFTEVGYVGRDVDSIIRDLTDVAVTLTRDKLRKEVIKKAKAMANERLLNALVGENASQDTRKKFREKLIAGELEEKEVEIEVQDSAPGGFSSFDIPGMPGGQMGVLNLGDVLGKALGGRLKTKRMPVSEASKILVAEESDKLIDEDRIIKEALYSVENSGIVFIDELDKITARSDVKGAGEVSREGVQRDLLPLLEGTIVSTKYGMVKTDHILFIASGAFHMAKPSDLLPELQGRLPIRVELSALTTRDLVKILKEPESSLLKQYSALLDVEGVAVKFSTDGIKNIASIAADVNRNVENIGARRLHTIMEKLLEDLSFEANELKTKNVIINAKYVETHLGDLVRDMDLTKFIL